MIVVVIVVVDGRQNNKSEERYKAAIDGRIPGMGTGTSKSDS